jgi:2-polyprenyl-3-methyl-5-hydroxy-6-metoxy-1,4-benzoquinol methylase
MSEYKDYNYNNSKPAHTIKYLLDPIVNILKDKNKLVLDIGCGNGWLVNYLIEKGYKAYGTDASESGISIAKGRNPDSFYLQDLTKDSLPIELSYLKFNTIISTEVIEHLYSPREYLEFCKKILLNSGGGEIIMTTPYHGYFKNIVLALTGKLDNHFTVLWDGGHIKFWSKKTIYDLLKEKGFKDMQFVGCGRVPFLWKSMLIKAKI